MRRIKYFTKKSNKIQNGKFERFNPENTFIYDALIFDKKPYLRGPSGDMRTGWILDGFIGKFGVIGLTLHAIFLFEHFVS